MNTNIKFFFILFASVLCIGFTSCSSDDDDKDVAKDIVANYDGSLLGAAEDPISTTIVIEHLSDNKVNLKLNQNIAGLPINIACATDVAKKDGKYSLSGNTTTDLPLGANGANVSIPVEVKGDVAIVANVKTAVINITVGNAALQAVVPVFPLTVYFTGTN
ncbi:hypothetical protein FACS1894181_07070 [Bacteroidia bacterium]|nr:hypothetical protein FACS1894181_07070 [Bacteroidia bacterium]